MIIPTRWADLPDGARVLDPTGAMFHVLRGVFPGIAQVRDASGKTYAVPAPPDVQVPRVYETEDMAVDVLRQHFSIEYLREGR